MTTAVQNLETAAYLPPPASPSASNANPKGSGAADPSGEQSDFQSELQLQDTGKNAVSNTTAKKENTKKENKAVGRSEISSGKPGKKPEASAEDSNPVVMIPVQAVDLQKQVQPLPLALTIALPVEQAKPDGNAQPDQDTEETVQTVQKGAQELRPAAEALAKTKPVGNDALPAAPDFSKVPSLPFPVNIAAPEDATSSKDQAAMPAKPAPLSASQPASAAALSSAALSSAAPSSAAPSSAAMPPAAMRLADSTPPEPVAANPQGAIQETIDAASSSPSALAFAARMAAAPQKADTSLPGNTTQSALASAQTPDRIPVRYAATAQILQDGAIDTKQGDGLKKDFGAAIERSAGVEPRTDMVLPRFETAREAAPNSAPAAPQQTAPSARTERVIETPPAPPTSSRDIRVQVPDNNGGSTQVRFVESGGEVRVSVRTADPALAQNLRSHLNDLSQRLADGGMPAEIWKPSANAASSQNDPNSTGRDGRGSGGQGSGGQGGQQDRQEQRPAWIEEMEASLDSEQH